MNEELSGTILEPERYELREPCRYDFQLDRRDFLQVVGGGLLVLLIAERTAAQESGRRGRRGGDGRPDEIGAWLQIPQEGKILVFTGKTEVGQNIRTSLAQAVAEELHAPLGSIQMVMADTDRTPYDRGTFGSRTTPDMAQQLRRMAAVARETLLELAGQHFGTDKLQQLQASDGNIVNAATGAAISYGELTRGQQLVRTVESTPALKNPSQWTVAGQSASKVDGRALVTGSHRYSCDLRRPAMLFGKILRAPSFEAELQSVDASRAEQMPGVKVVQDGAFVGLVAPDEQTAQRALEAIGAKWSEQSQPSHKELYQYLKQNQAPARGFGRSSGRRSGSMEEGLAKADHRTQNSYTIAYIAHAPLEPRAAVAEWDGQQLTVWTGTQRPFGVRGELSEALKIPEEQVRVIVPDTGSAYGGKHTGEAAVEAARLARAVGKPVKLVWTREEEFTWAYFRPAGLIEVTGGVTRDGKLTAWEFHNYNSGGSAIETPYEVPNQHIEFHSTRSPLRQGSYRALAATANTFAREMEMDELAHAVGQDPLLLRLNNLQEPRMRAVLEAAADAFGWDAKAGKNHGVGIACGTEKGSYVATCAEVAVEPTTGEVTVVRVTAAFECGPVVNPNHLRNQVEGAILMGLGGALFEAVEFENGKILNPRFSKYRVPRFRDAPKLEVVLVNRQDLSPAGAGETPIIAIAPAIGSAIFSATGVRLRSLPLLSNGKLNT